MADRVGVGFCSRTESHASARALMLRFLPASCPRVAVAAARCASESRPRTPADLTLLASMSGRAFTTGDACSLRLRRRSEHFGQTVRIACRRDRPSVVGRDRPRCPRCRRASDRDGGSLNREGLFGHANRVQDTDVGQLAQLVDGRGTGKVEARPTEHLADVRNVAGLAKRPEEDSNPWPSA